MATQSYVTELQAAPQASQPPQAPPQALPQPPPPAAPQPPAAATPQPQYVTELQSPQPQTQPPGSQKQYVAELPAAPAPSQPATPAPSPVAQQYIVVTVSEGAMRASETVSEASPSSTASQTGVPTQVVQQVQGTQQRLLVQASVQAKPGHVSPLQLTNIQVPQQAIPTQHLVVQSPAPGTKSGQVSLTVHSAQQVHSAPERSPVQANNSTSKTAGTPAATVQQLQVHSVQQSVPVTQERSVVQATPQTKAGPVQQLTVQGLQPVHVAQESSGSQFPARKAEQQETRPTPPPEPPPRPPGPGPVCCGEVLQLGSEQQPLHYEPGVEQWVELVGMLPPHLLLPQQRVVFEPQRGLSARASPDLRVRIHRMPQVLVFGTALKVQQLPQVPVPHVYSSQVQYVEGGDASYTASAIRSSTYQYPETPIYTQTAGTSYYEASGTAAQVSTPATSQTVASSGSVPMYVSGSPIVASSSSSEAGASNSSVGAGGNGGGGSSGGGSGGSSGSGAGTYVIQGGYMLGNASQSYSHTTRASPATVQWLLDNYETAEGVSLPRSTLYCHYLLHCQEQKLEPVNAASFGKLIRSVFMGLRTRRLGTRGNSKYHYYGLRIKASSPLLRLMEDQQHMAMRGQPFSQKQRLKPIQKMEGVANGVAVGQQSTGLSDISAQVQQYQQFLDASRSLPDFAELDLQGKVLPEGVGPGDIKAFQVLYREHCEAIVDVMVNLQFTLVETLWKTFWRYNLSQPSEAPPLAVHDEAEKRLPRASLVLLSKFQPVLQWTKHCDNVLYQGLVEILIPDVLRPIPSALTQAIRNFAKSLESWLTHAMVNIPEEMLRVKVAAAGAFAQTLRRYTSLNHLAQAARAVLQNTAQINQMLSDLNRVDFANVQEQASWVCRCEDRVVQRLEQDFKVTLQQQNSLEQWAAWLDGVVSQVLKPYQGSSGFPKAAKLFLLKWSFYSSMVIRDLTLRSAASFGSFHLIRLLYDEYMYYLIEHRVAQAKGETPIAVMGEFANLATSLNPLDPDKDEEEEEEEESEDELPQDISLAAGSESPALGPEALEPPAKLARTDTRGLFVQALPSS
ncbi:MHC class II regulatory factor RFX1 isoform X1 [Mus musculus]|uniref:MHC class II regulatory factor RFX1 isoform X1 n=2 Tax=Mus musculus TaxID=10090 RepID=UPI0003D77E68|nr:MHC class II regulatory factor RFX1 isoform X1 [Mus musculus]XP_036009732.1 MHC class II regulatory factor RFX1 isoform X1 [Mus musculus]|eukprot:XP_011246631.1 PREDICTED: MHC class II regulatory factor RFX1 isoform X1 [Mus musculus]